MKTDLITSIGAAIVGCAIAFFACNALLPAIEPVSFKKLDNATSSYSLVDPDPEIFNYRALNPTVEVYVGDCDEYDEYGNCLTDQDLEDDESEEQEEQEDETEDEVNLQDVIDEIINNTPTEPDQENQDGSTN